MKKILLLMTVFLISTTVFAQKETELKLNKENNLIEAVYYHDNGKVSQKGTYNLDGKLDGEWISFDTDGKKVATGYYNNGIKTGKWFFWSADNLKEVDYLDNRIANVNLWTNKETLAVRN